jgi:hypothetical protein
MGNPRLGALNYGLVLALPKAMGLAKEKGRHEPAARGGQQRRKVVHNAIKCGISGGYIR